MKEEAEMRFHNDVLSRFNSDLYKDILGDENISSKKIAIILESIKYYGYFLEKGKETYFSPSEFVELLPFKIKESFETDYKGSVFKFIKKPVTIKMPEEKKMNFRTLVDEVPGFEHTNPLHWTLYKIICYASYIDRINTRISTIAGFGKDSGVNTIAQLVPSIKNMSSATFAKLEYSLTNKFLIFNEMGNLKDEDKHNMQDFLLQVGAYFNNYTKRTRKTANTQEDYDISNLSLMILYNLPSYYISKNQEYFEQMFTEAVLNRFIPFHFEGTLSTKFGKVIDADKLMEENKEYFKDVISTINYYKANHIKEIKYEVSKDFFFTDKQERYARTFNTILKYLSEYCLDQEEFNELSSELYKCFLSYNMLVMIEK